MKYMLVAVLLSISSWTYAAESVVENAQKPKGTAMTLEFTEDLRFGADEEDDEFIWANPDSPLAANSKGHIFVADVKEARLLEFDGKGNFIREVASKGQGPGELQGIAGVSVLNDDSIVALNAGFGIMSKLLFFDNEGKYVKDLAPNGFSKIISSINFSPEGNYFGTIFVGINMETSVMTMKTGFMDLKFDVVHKFTDTPQDFNMQAFSTPDGIAQFMSDILTNAYKGMGVMTFDNEGYGYSAVSNSYAITKWSKDLKTKLMTIKRDYKPIANTDARKAAVAERSLEPFRNSPMGAQITENLVQKVIRKAELPLVNNPVNGLLAMEDGKILVIHDANPIDGVQVADIFSKQGQFLGQVTMENWAFVNPAGTSSMVFRNGFAYTMETDDEDENRIVRYTFKLKKI